MSSKAKNTAPAGGPVSPEEYGELVASAELQNIRLISSNLQIEPEAHSRDRANWKHVYDVRVQDVLLDAARPALVGLINGEVSCKIGRKKIVSVKSRYVVNYFIDGKPSQEAATMFIKRTGIFAVYPYFRAHFAELCSQAGIELPPLPVMKQGRQRVLEPTAAATERVAKAPRKATKER